MKPSASAAINALRSCIEATTWSWLRPAWATSARSRNSGITPIVSPPCSMTASATTPISPTSPPPYTRPISRAASAAPRVAATSAKTGEEPALEPQNTQRRGTGSEPCRGQPTTARPTPWMGPPDGRSVTSRPMTAPDLEAAAAAVDLAQRVVGKAVRHLSASGGPDAHQVFAYDLAHAASGVETARAMLDYGAKGEDEARLTCAFVADAVHDLASRVLGREALWDVPGDSLAEAQAFLTTYRDPAFLAALATVRGPRHLDPDFELVQDTFRAFAENEIAPVAEHVHRENADVPEATISGSA